MLFRSFSFSTTTFAPPNDDEEGSVIRPTITLRGDCAHTQAEIVEKKKRRLVCVITPPCWMRPCSSLLADPGTGKYTPVTRSWVARVRNRSGENPAAATARLLYARGSLTGGILLSRSPLGSGFHAG